MKIVSECGFSVGQNLSALYYKCWEARNAESLDEIFNLSLLQIRRRNLCCLLYTEMSFSKEKKKIFPFCLRPWRWKHNECVWKWAKSPRYFWSCGSRRWNFSPAQLAGGSSGSGFMRKRDQVNLIGPCPQRCVCGTWSWQSLTFLGSGGVFAIRWD